MEQLLSGLLVRLIARARRINAEPVTRRRDSIYVAAERARWRGDAESEAKTFLE
jgi:hypothetical protein